MYSEFFYKILIFWGLRIILIELVVSKKNANNKREPSSIFRDFTNNQTNRQCLQLEYWEYVIKKPCNC